MEVPHVYAMTFIGRDFLIEPVPAATTHAAHINFSVVPVEFCKLVSR
jgi:hypothetical protein